MASSNLAPLVFPQGGYAMPGWLPSILLILVQTDSLVGAYMPTNTPGIIPQKHLFPFLKFLSFCVLGKLQLLLFFVSPIGRTQRQMFMQLRRGLGGVGRSLYSPYAKL